MRKLARIVSMGWAIREGAGASWMVDRLNRERHTLVSILGWVVRCADDSKGRRCKERARCCFSGFGGHCGCNGDGEGGVMTLRL